MYEEPKIIRAGRAVDDRGSLTFCNDFHLAGVKRFYTVTNHRQGFVRAWHGHDKSDTYLWPIRGVWRLCAAPLRRAEPFTPGQRPQDLLQFCVDSTNLLHVPAGWFNGHQNLTDGAILGVFSTATLDQVRDDDHRNPWDCWPEVWQEQPR